MAVTDSTGTQNRKIKERDEELIVVLFSLLTHDTTHHLTAIIREYYAGTLSINSLSYQITVVLTDAHAQSAYLGRRLAGSSRPVGEADRAFSQLVMHEQSRYLARMIGDILNGRYPGTEAEPNADLIRRIQMYATRLLGTFNRTWAMAQSVGTMVNWILHPAEHCQDCISRAEGGPYDAHTIRWVPGDGSSECTVNCKCTLETV